MGTWWHPCVFPSKMVGSWWAPCVFQVKWWGRGGFLVFFQVKWWAPAGVPGVFPSKNSLYFSKQNGILRRARADEVQMVFL